MIGNTIGDRITKVTKILQQNNSEMSTRKKYLKKHIYIYIMYVYLYIYIFIYMYIYIYREREREREERQNTIDYLRLIELYKIGISKNNKFFR